MSRHRGQTGQTDWGGAVWITGAGSGIGQAVAERLASAPDAPALVVSGRRSEPLQALADRWPGITPVSLDVTDRAAVQAAVAALDDRIPVGLALLCAGTHTPTPATAFDAAMVRTLVDTNLMGIVHCVEALLPRMLARRSGTLALVASVAGYRGLPTAAGYAASKAAVIALAEALRLDLLGTGVAVRLINPGFVDTPLTRQNSFPMPDIISAARAADHVVHGLLGPSFEIAFPRRFALVMKLLRLMPNRLYFPLIRKVTGC